MHSDSSIHLVIATDAHHLIMLAALLKSIETNHKSGEVIHAYLIESGVSAEDKEKIQRMLNPQLFFVHWMNMKEVIPSGVQLPVDLSSFPLITYMRLFIHSFMPAGVTKALFMDADMLMLEDISKLWHIELGDHVIAAVQDPRVPTFDNKWGGVKNYKTLGFAAATPYFNSGLLLININQWRAQQVASRVIDTINHNKRFANYPDQYGLNVVLANQWLPLDERWNYFASYTDKQPFNIHFISRKPFYKSYKNNKHYQQLFYHYLAQTPWRDARPVTEVQRYIKKLDNIWEKIKQVI